MRACGRTGARLEDTHPIALLPSLLLLSTVYGLPVTFIDPLHPASFFARDQLYGYEDDFERCGRLPGPGLGLGRDPQWGPEKATIGRVHALLRISGAATWRDLCEGVGSRPLILGSGFMVYVAFGILLVLCPPRFIYFSRAALEYLLRQGKHPDIIHLHDWQTALCAPLFWDIYHNQVKRNEALRCRSAAHHWSLHNGWTLELCLRAVASRQVGRQADGRAGRRAGGLAGR